MSQCKQPVFQQQKFTPISTRLGAVHMRRAIPVDRTDLCHENVSAFDDFELDWFTTNIYWICLSNLLLLPGLACLM